MSAFRASSAYKHAAPAFVGLFCAVFAPVLGMAAPAGDDEETRLAPVQVVGSPIIEGNVVSRYGTESTVVGKSQIEDMNAQDIASALRRTPGVTISRYNPVGSFGGSQGGGVFVRGSGSSRPGGELLILYDGIPRINPLTNHPLLDIISIDPAASVQVYKSPQPQIFGNAHAAIDVQTKSKDEEGFLTKVGAQFGSHRSIAQTAEHGGKSGAYDYYIGQSFKHSDGHRKHSSGDLQSWFARLGAEVGENWKVSGFGNFTDNKSQDPGDGRSFGGPADAAHANWDGRNHGRYGTKDAFGYLDLSHKYEKAAGSVKTYVSHGEARWDGETRVAPMPPPPHYVKGDLAMDWDSYGLRATERLFPLEGSEILLGCDVDAVTGGYTSRTRGSNAPPLTYDRDLLALTSPYAAISWRFGKKDGWRAIPSAGMRRYMHNVFAPQNAPHAGLIVGYMDTELHFGYARSVVYPGLNVALFSKTISTPIANNNPHGWRNLSAEVMDHYEAGVSHKFGALLKADFTAFWDEGRDRYRMYSNSPTGAPPQGFDNLDKYRKSGYEGSLAFTPTETLSLFAGAAYLHTDPSWLPYSPKWTISTGFNLSLPENIRLSADALYRDAMYTDSWSRAVPAQGYVERGKVDESFLLNAKLSYFFELPTIHLEKGEIFLAVENITNTVYEYAPGYRMPGTTFMAGFSLTF
ncbi:MAG: TonB-dependent receptor plug domain-containing protein [Deltaproteobacteria bacterium]|jgi:iron complex outermembrane receptor protein|nr:TonB-dependent receptor plug domain-containing protein [Deltaproteobacteria bacterium]